MCGGKSVDYFEIKEMYNKVRTDEAQKIFNFFKNHKDFEVEKRAVSQGRRDYSSKRRLDKKYDLSNWKWICVKRNDVHFLISLQSFDRDPDTENLHVLMDRIGIYAYTGDYSPIDAQTKMMITNVELPINSNKLDELAKILKALSEYEIYKIQAQFEKVRSEYNLI